MLQELGDHPKPWKQEVLARTHANLVILECYQHIYNNHSILTFSP